MTAVQRIHRSMVAAALFALSAPAFAATLPPRTPPADPEMRRLEIARADLDFAFLALKAGASGSGAPIGASDRLIPAEISAATTPADRAWAATVARAAAVFPGLAGIDPPRDVVAQSFDGWYAVSVAGYGRLAGHDPDQVLGAFLQMIADSRRGNGRNPGVDWQPQIGIMGRISLAIVGARGQGLK